MTDLLAVGSGRRSVPSAESFIWLKALYVCFWTVFSFCTMIPPFFDEHSIHLHLSYMAFLFRGQGFGLILSTIVL